MILRFPFIILLLILLTVAHVPADMNPVIGAYFYLFDDGYNNTMNIQGDIPWNKINRLYIAFATVKDGSLTNIQTDGSEDLADERIKTIVNLCKKANPDVEIFISSNYGLDVTEEYLNAADNPEEFAESVLNYLQRYDLDGYDMDWEDHKADAYKDEQIRLLDACKDAFDASIRGQEDRPYVLTCTIWPGVHDPETVVSYVPYVDQMNLMTYGTGDAYDLSTFAKQYHDAGVPYEKMIGGVESEIDYSDNVGPDTNESIQAKGQLVQEKSMAGLMNWRMDSDMVGTNSDGTITPSFQVTDQIYRVLSGDS